MRKTTEDHCEWSSRSKYWMVISRLTGSRSFGSQCRFELCVCVKTDLYWACAFSGARTRYRRANQIYQLSRWTLNKYCATGFFSFFVCFLVVFRTSSTGYTKMYLSLQISLLVCVCVCVWRCLCFCATWHNRAWASPSSDYLLFLLVPPALPSKSCILLTPRVGI